MANTEEGESITKIAQRLHRRDLDAWADIYRKGKDDLHFLSDADDAQWDSKDLQKRRDENRPALTIDQLSQFVHQTANDVRMNTPTINIIPSDDEATVDIAEARKKKIKEIEYRSKADDAYDMAVTAAIKSSIGFIRVDHDYIDDSDKQEFSIKRVVNQFSMTIDSSSTEVDGSDAMHGHIVEKLTGARFKERFPDREPVSFQVEGDGAPRSCGDDEEMHICEFFRVVETPRQVGYLNDGTMEDYNEANKGLYKLRRTLKTRKVERYTLNGEDEPLEETIFPGKYVPIVPVYGEEAWINGKRHLHSLIRKSKDAQRLGNLMASVEVETIMKQPNAPVMVDAGSVEDFAEDWLNPFKSMVLRYWGEKDGKKFNKPERLLPAGIPAGFVNARRESTDDIKSTLGMYGASVGQRTNETSGVAINSRKAEGDMATYHFGDNLVKSITHVGRIIDCGMETIYDTPRIILGVDEEGVPKPMGINGMVADGQEKTIEFNKGKYSVRVVTGAPFTTMRQEAAAFYTDIVTKVPELMNVMGDLLFKYQDFPGAQAMAERMKKFIDPKFLEENGEDAQVQQLTQALTEAKGLIEQLQQQLADKTEAEKAKNQVEILKSNNELAETQINAEVAAMETEIKGKELLIKDKELEIKSQELVYKTEELRARPDPSEQPRPGEIEQSGSI